MKWWRKFKERRRFEKVMRACGCVCRCPACHDILNDQAECYDDIPDQRVYYRCGCGECSIWTFDAAPIPLLLA